MKSMPAASADPGILQVRAGDIAGSVGNFGTIIPLFCALSLTCGIPLPQMLLLCGIWYILTGVIYQIPIPVEPLKAVAAIAIAGHLSRDLITAAGIITGILFLALGCSRGMGWVRDRIPGAVIRGIQAGLGLILLRTALLEFGMADPVFFLGGLLCIGLFLLIRHWREIPDLSALLILTGGMIIAITTTGVPEIMIPSLPPLILPSGHDYLTAAIDLVIPQIPLTLANAILATSLLATELYHRPVSPDRLSLSIGVMSLSSSLLGGFPMCHGAGGVAAHHRFGARGPASLFIGGLILIAGGVLFTDPATITAIPQGLFGSLLLVVAAELILHGARTDAPLVTGLMAVIAIPAGMAAAFVAGLMLAAVTSRKKYRQKGDETAGIPGKKE